MSPNVAASVRDRLLRAKAEGEPFELTLTRFAAERLLYRLGRSPARSRCLLKGAALLAVWLSDPYRATRDVDVLASGPTDDDAIRLLLADICAVECPEDGLEFDFDGLTIETIRPEDEYSGKRARFRAFLGKASIPVQIDIGVGDAVVIEPEEVEYPTLLETLPAPSLRAYPREATVAEKFEAMVKLDIRNSRMKDFHDVWALAGAFTFDGSPLQAAVAACFELRNSPWTSAAPRALTVAFYQMPEIAERWRRYLAAGAVLMPPPAPFDVVGDRIIQFLGPIRDSIISEREFTATWPPEGPWKPGT